MKDFGLTTDIWMSQARHGYISVTIHIDESFQLQSHLLATKEFPESHTADNIHDELLEIMTSDWQLPERGAFPESQLTTVAILLLQLISSGGLEYLALVIHCKIGVEKTMKIPQVQKALARCRFLVGHFNHCAKS